MWSRFLAATASLKAILVLITFIGSSSTVDARDKNYFRRIAEQRNHRRSISQSVRSEVFLRKLLFPSPYPAELWILLDHFIA